MRLRIGLLGEQNTSYAAHRAIPLALDLAAAELGVDLQPAWISTDTVVDTAPLHELHGLWCVPGSPYRSMDGVLRGIEFARRQGLPFLGTCGGFQHALLEYARNVLGWREAEHAETAPESVHQLIRPLGCALIEVGATVHLQEGTSLRAAYGGAASTTEVFHCRYGLDPARREWLLGADLRLNAVDDQGEVRGVELAGHPFFVATLFQSERAALQGQLPVLVRAFANAALMRQ